jgi:lysozyme
MQAAKFIKTQEGCRLTAYTCSGGNRTIGYGTSWGRGNTNRISQELADRLFFNELVQCESYLKDKITVQLFDYEWVALADHVYNLGSLSTGIIELVNNYKMEEAAELMSRYIHADGRVIRGLKIRVRARVDLFLGKKKVNLKSKGKQDLLCTPNKPLTYLKGLTAR